MDKKGHGAKRDSCALNPKQIWMNADVCRNSKESVVKASKGRTMLSKTSTIWMSFGVLVLFIKSQTCAAQPIAPTSSNGRPSVPNPPNKPNTTPMKPTKPLAVPVKPNAKPKTPETLSMAPQTLPMTPQTLPIDHLRVFIKLLRSSLFSSKRTIPPRQRIVNMTSGNCFTGYTTNLQAFTRRVVEVMRSRVLSKF